MMHLRSDSGMTPLIPIGRAVPLLLAMTCFNAPHGDTGMRSGPVQPSYAILPEDYIRGHWQVLGGCGPADTAGESPGWQPSTESIAVVDVHVRQHIERALERASVNSVDATDYFVQYFGVYYSGLRAIHVNAVLRRYPNGGGYDPAAAVFNESDPHQLMGVCDGGIMRFTAVVDTAGGEIVPGRFNSTEAGTRPGG